MFFAYSTHPWSNTILTINYVFLSFNPPTLFTKTLYLSLKFKADQLLPVEKTFQKSTEICLNLFKYLYNSHLCGCVPLEHFPTLAFKMKRNIIRQVSCRCDGWTCASPVFSSHQPSCSDVSSPRRHLLSSWFMSLIKPVCVCACARVWLGAIPSLTIAPRALR